MRLTLPSNVFHYQQIHGLIEITEASVVQLTVLFQFFLQHRYVVWPETSERSKTNPVVRQYEYLVFKELTGTIQQPAYLEKDQMFVKALRPPDVVSDPKGFT